jgi:30S ribosome assembly GTPase
MDSMTTCKGCGAVLQTTDQQALGYASDLDQRYCRSCYRLRHYGEGGMHFHPENMPKITPGSLVLLMSSVLHMDLLFQTNFSRIQPDAKVVYVINQIDLLPSGTNKDLFLERIERLAKRENTHLDDIILMSSKSADDLDQLKRYLRHQKAKEVFLLGVQNSGKTTVFKALTGNQDALAMKKAGLTQQTLSGTFEKMMIHDMPGLYQKGYLHTFMPYETYKRLIPEETINPRIYIMKPDQSLMLEGLVAITNTGKTTFSAVFYISPMVSVHVTNRLRVPLLLKNHKTQFEISCDDYETRAFNLKPMKMQLTFADMGFMHVTGPAHITLHVCKAMHVSLTEALFK